MMIPLGEIISLQKGKKPKVQSKDFLSGYLPNIDIKAFEQGLFEYYTDGVGCVPCEEGDILIVCDGSRSGLVGFAKKGVVGSTLAKISHSLWVDKKFLLYFIQEHYIELNTKMKGTGTPHVNQELLLSFPFPVFGLKQQRRIVAKIDALFSELDKGVELLQTVRQQLKTYRQAVLKWAFKRHGDFALTNLSQIAEIVGGITKGRKLEPEETILLPYLAVANVQDGYLNLNNVRTIPLKKSEREKYILQIDDVLYTEGGDKDKLGRGTIWKGEIQNCVHQNHIFRARVNADKALPKYVALYSQTQNAKAYFYSKGKQSVNLASINKTVLRNLPIPLPSKEIQQEIVQDVENGLSTCDKLEQLVDESLAKSQALRQSILKKAFEGKLVPQDPNDEPAEKLLERIKAEKTSSSNKGTKVRKKKQP
jgi:type I restriction enzyme S subunit